MNTIILPRYYTGPIANKIVKLNSLIEQYNQNSSPEHLERIDAAAKILYLDCEKALNDPSINIDKREVIRIFMQWYFQNPIQNEICYLLKLEELKGEKYPKKVTDLSTDAWIKSTTPKTGVFHKGRSKQYEEMDDPIKEVEQAKRELDKAHFEYKHDKKEKEYYCNALIALQIKISYILNNQLPKNKTQMRQHFEKLFLQTNSLLDNLLEESPDIRHNITLTTLAKDDQGFHFSQVTYPSKEAFFRVMGESTKLTLANWEKLTKDKKGARNADYQQMDKLIQQVETCYKSIEEDREHEESSSLINELDEEDLNLSLHNALLDLQNKALEMVYSDAIQNDPKMIKNFQKLLDETNYAINKLSLNSLEVQKIYKTNLPVSLGSVDFATSLVDKLGTQQQQFAFGDFQVRWLGGKNNKNWEVTHNANQVPPTILRLEQANNSDYCLLNVMQADHKVAQHLAKESYFFPCMHLKQKYNIVWSEHCPNRDILTYCKNKYKGDDNDALDQALDLTKKVTILVKDFHNSGLAYPDIKGSNFLLREDGTVITADYKAIVRIKNDGNLPKIEFTRAYEPPDPYPMNAETYMTYKIGLMLYELVVAPGYEGQEDTPWLDRERPLDFDLPIFQSKQGQDVKKLIESAMNPDLTQRCSLEYLIKECKVLQENPISYKEKTKEAEQEEITISLSQ